MLSKIEICVGAPRKAEPGALHEFHSYVARYKCATKQSIPYWKLNSGLYM